jgi:hypothetical protein
LAVRFGEELRYGSHNIGLVRLRLMHSFACRLSLGFGSRLGLGKPLSYHLGACFGEKILGGLDRSRLANLGFVHCGKRGFQHRLCSRPGLPTNLCIAQRNSRGTNNAPQEES